MRSRVLFPLLGLVPFTTVAQVDLPVFGKQHVINGYAKDVEGEVLSYFSVYPEHATTALLTRCTDGAKAIAWETAMVPFYPQDENIQYYYFSWIAAHNSTTSGGDRSFDLFINDQLALTFTTHHDTKPGSWSAAGADSTKLVFEFSKADRHGDAHGFAHLRVPRKYITPGQPVKLKVVGHAQNSPDWFMTFRYTFMEKMEVEVLPFIRRDGKQELLLTMMHFGAPNVLAVSIDDEPIRGDFKIVNGLNEFRVPIEPVTNHSMIAVRSVIDRRKEDPYSIEFDKTRTVDVLPIIHRDIHLVHHSHTDIGYSHLQAEVERIQNNNIWKALELIDRTKDYPEGSRFVWNVESLWAVENFLGIASEADKQRFIAAVKSGSIALSANYANILTGLCSPEEMHWIVEYADSLRKWYDLPITMAMQTDIPGMSWSMVDAHAAHGIRHLSQGPNYIPDMPDGGDRIGSTLREQGDKPYWWKSTTGKDSILVWTAGQGYGGWHGYTAGAIKERGTRKIAAYMNDLTAKGYPYDMLQWRYNIVSDNGPVDSTLSDFVRDWNEKYASPRLIIANAGEMMQQFEEKYGKDIPTWSGDFTPYWEDGAYSTAKEEGDVRVLSARLSNLIDAAKILGKPIDPHMLYRAKRSIVMWHEHTWGSWCSISDPDAHFTTDQWRVKKAFADSAAWYVNEIEYGVTPMDDFSEKLEVINTHPWEWSSLVYLYDVWNLSSPDSNQYVISVTGPSGKKQIVQRESADRGPSHFPVNVKGRSVQPFIINVTENQEMAANAFREQGDSDQRTNEVPNPTLSYVKGTSSQERHELRVLLKDTLAAGPFILSLSGQDSSYSTGWVRHLAWYVDGQVHLSYEIDKTSIRDKESLHLALPFNIPNATVRIGISDTCVTPESGRIPGSNNDFFCAQRWIDVSNDSMGVTIVCPQGAIWEVGEMVDERKVNPGKGTNPEKYKAWKTEAKSSSTIYLYALNNYWHTNFKADQEGPITFNLYLKMHGPFKLEEARRFGLEMTRPLITWWK
jgi:alpha-mannosidase